MPFKVQQVLQALAQRLNGNSYYLTAIYPTNSKTVNYSSTFIDYNSILPSCNIQSTSYDIGIDNGVTSVGTATVYF